MKSKVICLLLGAVMAAGVLAGCGNKAASTENTSNTSSDKTEDAQVSDNAAASGDDGKFIVGFDAEYPPYGYMDENGEYTGFDLELAQAVCDMEGWEFVAQPIAWEAKDQELDSGAIDCIWNGFTINGREDEYEFSDAYVNNEQVIVVSSTSGIKALTDLAGKTVGVQQASAALDVLTDEEQQKSLGDTFGTMQQFTDYNVAFTELQSGSLDALAIDVGVAEYQISSRGADDFIILSEPLNSEQYGVGFKLGNTALRDTVNADLHKLAADGTIKTLAEKYEIADMICIE